MPQCITEFISWEEPRAGPSWMNLNNRYSLVGVDLAQVLLSQPQLQH